MRHLLAIVLSLSSLTSIELSATCVCKECQCLADKHCGCHENQQCKCQDKRQACCDPEQHKL
jgi:hypothetical protein